MRVKLLCPPAVVAVTVAASLTLAACGSSNSSSSSASGTGTQSAGSSTTGTNGTGNGTGRGMMTAEVQACLKKEGVTLPSRPTGGGNGNGGPPQGGGYGLPGAGAGAGAGRGGYGGGFGGNMSSTQRAKMQAAFKKCGVTFGQNRGAPGAGMQRPDTTSTAYRAAVTKYTACVRQNGYDLPDPDFSGKGPIFAAKIQKDATFQAASKKCQSLLANATGAGGGGQPPQGGTNGQQPATTTGTTTS
jgi:hypothetical protein